MPLIVNSVRGFGVQTNHNNMKHTLDRTILAGIFYVGAKKPAKQRVWFYQFPNEEKQQLIKDGRWWYYNTALVNGGLEIGCDSLSGAKGDLLYSGAKVWSELV